MTTRLHEPPCYTELASASDLFFSLSLSVFFTLSDESPFFLQEEEAEQARQINLRHAPNRGGQNFKARSALDTFLLIIT